MNDNSYSAVFNDPAFFIPSSLGVKGDVLLEGFWRNEEVEMQVAKLESPTDLVTRCAALERILTIVEAEDPIVLIWHETATFTAMRRNIKWQPAKSFVMDFRSRNF